MTVKDQNNETIETLDMTDRKKKENVQDIPKPFFRPIGEIQEEQNAFVTNYEQSHPASDMNVPDLSNDVRILEQKLAKKKNAVSLKLVILIVLAINLIWFLAVQFFILPKCENCIQPSSDIHEEVVD